MPALKYYNEQLYVSEYGNAYEVRQVGEYYYQIKDLIRNKMVASGCLLTIEDVKYIISTQNLFRVKDLVRIYESALVHRTREQ